MSLAEEGEGGVQEPEQQEQPPPVDSEVGSEVGQEETYGEQDDEEALE